MDCVFCGIISGTFPSRKIYEDEFSCVFLDIAGDADGHMVAVPKKHVESIFDCDAETLHHLMDAVKQVSDHCIQCGYSGVNLLNASGACAGQSVPHFHIHIIPRKPDDGIDAWPKLPGGKSAVDAIHQLLKM